MRTMLDRLWIPSHNQSVAWLVEFHEEYNREFGELEPLVQDEILSLADLLEEFGPMLKRPHCDTLKGSKHTNMKELRFSLPGGV